MFNTLPSRFYNSGVTMFGFMVGFLGFVLIIFVSVKFVPYYLEYVTVVSVIEEYHVKHSSVQAASEIRDEIKQRLSVEILSVDVEDIIDISRKPDYFDVKLSYEKRENLFFNVDTILVFDRDFRFNR